VTTITGDSGSGNSVPPVFSDGAGFVIINTSSPSSKAGSSTTGRFIIGT
jgi:hypothetical protein